MIKGPGSTSCSHAHYLQGAPVSHLTSPPPRGDWLFSSKALVGKLLPANCPQTPKNVAVLTKQNTDSHLDAQLGATSQNNLRFWDVEEMLAALAACGGKAAGMRGHRVGSVTLGQVLGGLRASIPGDPSAQLRLTPSPWHRSPASSWGCLCDTRGPSTLHLCHFLMNAGARKVVWTRTAKGIYLCTCKKKGLCVCALNKVIGFPGWLCTYLHFK